MDLVQRLGSGRDRRVGICGLRARRRWRHDGRGDDGRDGDPGRCRRCGLDRSRRRSGGRGLRLGGRTCRGSSRGWRPDRRRASGRWSNRCRTDDLGRCRNRRSHRGFGSGGDRSRHHRLGRDGSGWSGWSGRRNQGGRYGGGCLDGGRRCRRFGLQQPHARTHRGDKDDACANIERQTAGPGLAPGARIGGHGRLSGQGVFGEDNDSRGWCRRGLGRFLRNGLEGPSGRGGDG